MVAWGHRGESLNNMAFSLGSGGGFSAVTHYDHDMSWGDESPLAGQWHHLVYTYDGRRPKFMTTEPSAVQRISNLPPAAANHDEHRGRKWQHGEPLFESEWDPNWPLALSGSIAMVRVHSGALTADQVKANFNANKERFGIKGQ